MSEHKHRWLYMEQDEQTAMFTGGRWLAVCIEGAFPKPNEHGDVDCGQLCQEQKYDHALPPGYRRLEEKLEFTTRPHISHGYVFDEKYLRRQLGEP